jgi:ubiquinone/menaquinone biosynthesis C-methylase UbiE
MTASPNQEQSDAWNGESGRRWVTGADERDQVLAPVADTLFAAAALTPGLRVLDIGCGCGATTLRAAAVVGTTGSAIGIDLSGPMLDVARERADASGATNTAFVQGDAQTHEFSPDTVDVVIARFGTMFFSDPIAAFRNIGRSLRHRGRLVLATWQPLAVNQWLTVPGAALLHHTAMPDQASDGPGMFAQSDPGTVMEVLHRAGFIEVALEPTNVTFTLGPTIDAAVDYLAESGLRRALLETIPDGAARDAALADVRAALVHHDDGTAVRLDGAIWIITAERQID